MAKMSDEKGWMKRLQEEYPEDDDNESDGHENGYDV